jgi:hypothetical protein
MLALSEKELFNARLCSVEFSHAISQGGDASHVVGDLVRRHLHPAH